MLAGFLGRSHEFDSSAIHFTFKWPTDSAMIVLHLGVILRVKTCKVFLCSLAIIFLGSIVFTSQWLLCINCFTSLVSFKFTSFYSDYKPRYIGLKRLCRKYTVRTLFGQKNSRTFQGLHSVPKKSLESMSCFSFPTYS